MKKKNSLKNFSLAAVLALMAIAVSCATAPRSEERARVTGTALSPKQQKVLSIAAFTAVGDSQNLRRAISEGLDSGLTVNEIGEILLQSYAYAGFPRSLNGVGVLSAVLEERQGEGKRDPMGVEPDFLPGDTDRYALGVTNLGALMGFPLQQQKGATNGYNEAMDAFLKEHLFADIFGRDNLSFDMRELATVGILASLEGTNSQMLFHMGAAMTTGITEEQMRNAVEVIAVEMGTERGDNAGMVLEQVLERRRGGGMPPAPRNDGGYPYIPEVFPRGEFSGNEMIFTGDTWVAPLVPREAPGIPVVNVTFAPGARTTWHAHSYVQILLVTMGEGYYQEEGKDPVRLRAGDSVHIAPGVVHWHGSAPGEWFAHVALIVPVESDAENLWLGPVSEEDYRSLR